MSLSSAARRSLGGKKKLSKMHTRSTKRVKPDIVLRTEIAGAVKLAGAKGLLQEPSNVRISTRLPPALVDVAKKRSGIKKDSELIKAALALMVGHDDFITWFLENRGKLSDEFELAV